MGLFRSKTNKNKVVIPLQFTDLGDGGCHIIIKAKINGKSARLIVDTGASHTMFDKSRFERFVSETNFEKTGQSSTGVGSNSMETHFTNIKKFTLGTIKFIDWEVVVIDISHVNQALLGAGLRPVDGVIGGDFLKKFNALIDYQNKELSLFQ